MDDVQPVFNPAITSYLAIAIISVVALIGLRFAWRAFLLRFVFNKPFNDPQLQEMADSMPPDRSGLKALAALAVAAFLTWLFFFGGLE